MHSTLLRVAVGFRGPNFPKTMKIPGFTMQFLFAFTLLC